MTQDFVKFKGKKYKVKNNRIKISGKKVTNISELINLEKLTSLTGLDLGSNQISEIKGLEKLTSLQELKLDRNQITEIKGLENLTSLIELDLASNQISEIKGLEKLVNLQKLYLYNNRIGDMKVIEKLTNLHELDLGSNQISEIRGCDKLEHLQQLLLDNNNLSEIKGLEKLPILYELNLGSNQISEIKGLEKLTWLHELDLGSNQITEIKGLKNLTNLQSLELNSNPIFNWIRRKFGQNLEKFAPQKLVKYCLTKSQELAKYHLIKSQDKSYAEMIKTEIEKAQIAAINHNYKYAIEILDLIKPIIENINDIDLKAKQEDLIKNNLDSVIIKYINSQTEKAQIASNNQNHRTAIEILDLIKPIIENINVIDLKTKQEDSIKKNLDSVIIKYIDSQIVLSNNLSHKKMFNEAVKLLNASNDIINLLSEEFLHSIHEKLKNEIRKISISKIKKTTLDLGKRFTRLQAGEIAEKCGENEVLIISTIKNMIKNGEIYAEYFETSRSVAFDQRAIEKEIDKFTSLLDTQFKNWGDMEKNKKNKNKS